MIKKNRSRLILIILLALVLGTGLYFYFHEGKSGDTLSDELFGWKYPVTKFPRTGPGDNQLAYSDIRDPGGIPEGLPVRLKIPAINVDSAIEDALITPDGRMDVPAGSINVAWFALGPHPGDKGSAVIGGHFGIRNGVKFVFYDLDKLIVGDKIYIENDKGETLAFQVRRIELFNRNDDATTVFTSEDGLAHLNLITCEGIWNRVNDSYPERRVVFTDAIPAEEINPIAVTGGQGSQGITKAQDLATFYRTLRVGTSGGDVVALQNALREIGIFEAVTDGSFGPITKGAVARFQSSARLSPDGIFGPFTRNKLIAELGGDTGFPSAGVERTLDTGVAPSVPKEPTTSPQISIQSLKSLYETPGDALITSLLLFLIAFVVFKIIRR